MPTNDDLTHEFEAIISQLNDVQTATKKTKIKYKTYWSVPAGTFSLLSGLAILTLSVWLKIIPLGIVGFIFGLYGAYVLVDRFLNSLTVDKTVRKASSFKAYIDKLDQERFGLKEDHPRDEYLT